MAIEEPQRDPRAGLSRRDLLRRGGAFVGAFALGSLAAACGGGDGEEAAAPPAEEGATPPAEEGAAPPPPAEGGGSGGTVNWLSWPGHNDPSFIQPFTDETRHQGAREGVLGRRQHARPRHDVSARYVRRRPGRRRVHRAAQGRRPARAARSLRVPVDRGLPGRVQAGRGARPGARARRRHVRPHPALRLPRAGLQLREGDGGRGAVLRDPLRPEGAGEGRLVRLVGAHGPDWAVRGSQGQLVAGGSSSIRTTSTRTSSRRWSTRFSR